MPPESPAPGGCELSIVVPAYNEAGNVAITVAAIERAVSPLGKPFEILLMDDGSADGTREEALRAKPGCPPLRILSLRGHRGKSAALAAAFRAARGRTIVTIDADLQEDPAQIPELLAKLDGGFDLAGGWRRERNDPPGKVLSSRLFNAFVRALTRTSFRDVNCGFKAYRREVVERIDLFGELHRVIPILAGHAGFRVAEIPVRHQARARGVTKYPGIGRGLHGILDLLTVEFLTHYQRRPLHFFGSIGVAAFAAGTAIELYLTVRYLMGIQFIGDRLPLFMLGILLLILGFQSFCMGLLGEMIARGARREPREDPVEIV